MVVEAESGALLQELSNWPGVVSSTLARLEVVRAVRRIAIGSELDAQALMTRPDLVPVTDALLRSAERAGHLHLGALDAVHLVTAQAFLPELGAFITYDRRLIESAVAEGLPVLSPGLAI